MAKNYAQKLSAIKQKGKLTVADDIGFERMQVANDIFGMGYKPGFFKYGNSFLKIPQLPNAYLWFPYFVPHDVWNNTISANGYTIAVTCIADNTPEIPDACVDKGNSLYTFAKCEDGAGVIAYRFVGVFVYAGTKGATRIYKRISDTVDI
ncbi:MAG: hypothetical protein Ta2B_31030 [Termitinemataceae bacterium]|nr:MAG: hypothetical protein Ta2B_31030 [Termitinemataceae bacterium]